MPLLRKGVLLAGSEGVDWSKPATFINDQAGFPKNMILRQGEMRKRPGKTEYQDLAMDTQVMGYGVLKLSSGTQKLVRASKTKMQYYRTDAQLWDIITATAFTGGDDDFFHFTNYAEGGLLLSTNYQDKIRKWDAVGNVSALGGNPPLCKYMCSISPYVLIANLIASGDSLPWAIDWCDTDNPEEWDTGNSGRFLASSDPSVIKNITALNEGIGLYKDDALYFGYKVDPPDIFHFTPVLTSIGLSASRAYADIGGSHIFMAHNDFYQWNGGLPVPIGKSVREEVFSRLDRSKIERCFALHIKYYFEVWFFIVVSGESWPTEIWKYNYRTGFWYYDTCSEITAAVAWKKYSSETWDGDSGTWDEALDDWDSGDAMQDWEEVVFGDSSGNSMRLDKNSVNDMGNAISAVLESKDYTAARLETYKRWLQLDVWARGSNGAHLYVDYSMDHGSTWKNIPRNSSQAYIDLTEAKTLYRLYFDVIADHIRFRFRNDRSGEMIIVTNYYPYYKGHAEVRG